MAEQRTPSALRKLIDRYAEVRLERERVEPMFKKLEAEEDRLAERIFTMMEEYNLSSVKYDDVGRIIRSQRGPYCYLTPPEEGEMLGDGDVPETSRELFEAWCKQNNIDYLIKPVPVMTRVNSEVKARIKNGGDLPAGISWRYVRGVTWSDRPSDKASPKKKVSSRKNG